MARKTTEQYSVPDTAFRDTDCFHLNIGPFLFHGSHKCHSVSFFFFGESLYPNGVFDFTLAF